MSNRERSLAVLNYESYDRLPVVHFGFWGESVGKWAREGHITPKEAEEWADKTPVHYQIARKLGFDFDWNSAWRPVTGLFPPFEERILKTHPDGSEEILDEDGAIVVRKPGITSIPTSIDHLLKGRQGWEEHFLPRLQFTEERITGPRVHTDSQVLPFREGGLEYLQRGEWENPYGLFCGSLYGKIRNWLGLEGSAYLQVDDPVLFDEIIQTVGDLCFETLALSLREADAFDFGHFWEDICFKSGPLINPQVFREKVGPHYRRVTDLLSQHGITIVSLDCDGMIDALIPIWLENGVNTMFPIEVGTWGSSIAPWRAKYGKELRGVGGMDKRVFAHDYAAVDAEVERLKPLVDLGGYIPCPDHRIPADAKWENIQYYCERMRSAFG